MRSEVSGCREVSCLSFVIYSLALDSASDFELLISDLGFIRPCEQACLPVGKFVSCYLVLSWALRSDAVLTLLPRVPTASPDFEF